MRKKSIAYVSVAFLLSLLTGTLCQAQVSLMGQIRTRTELRNGFGTLRPSDNEPAFFTSQRSRLTFNYKGNHIIFQTTLQDVRVWGQDASSITPADGLRLGVHEAWAEIQLSNKKDTTFKKSAVDYFSVKIGRQELVYDDSRLLGNLDWLQQGRRHDALVFKLLQGNWQVDLGTAFNQNTDAFNYNGTYYTPANVTPYIKDSKGNLVATPAGLIPIINGNGISGKTGTLSVQNPPGTNALNQYYKALEFLYAAKNLKRGRISALFLSDQFAKYRLDSVRNIAGADTGFVYGRRYNQAGVNARFTTGLFSTWQLNSSKSLAATIGAYYQGGKDREGSSLSAYSTTVGLSLTKKQLTYTAGWDYLSGNDAFSSSTTNHRFDPLYGMPHKFWGFMDYFYAGTGSPAGGLSDAFARIRFTSLNKRFSTQLDYHYFALAQDQKDLAGQALKKYLGSEFDLISTYGLNKITTLELGLAWMAATRSMEYAKGITPGTSKLNANWAYLQVNIKPEFLFH